MVVPGSTYLFAGRLIADKRVDVLLDAFDKVAAKHDVYTRNYRGRPRS